MEDLGRFKQIISTQGILEYNEVDNLPLKVESLYEILHDTFPYGPDKIDPSNKQFIIRSKSSKLIINPTRAVLKIDYFGNYLQDYKLCHDYLAPKLSAALSGIKKAFNLSIQFIAIIHDVQVSFNGLKSNPIEILAKNYLKINYSPDLADVLFRVGLKKADKYFINYEASHYQSRIFEALRDDIKKKDFVHLHEMALIDSGIKFGIDVNTKLEAMSKLPSYENDDLTSLLAVVYETMEQGLPKFMQGQL